MRHLLLIGMVALSTAAHAQTMTLRQCIETGLERNLGVRTVAEDVRTADVTRSENRSKLLPVIQAFGNFVDNVHRGTSVTDGSGISKLLGMDVPYMKNQGLQYTVQGGLQAQMPLYDHTIYIGMRIADRMKELSLVSLDKAREDLTMQIAQLYYRLATVLYCLAMVLNTSSSLTNAIASIGLTLDTYLNNMLANWAPLGYLIGAVTIIVLRSKGVAYKWVFAIGFGIFAWTMWFTYNQVQLQARYEDIRMLSIVRNCGMFMLYCICMVYAYQRLPYRLMPSWIHIMLISRSVMGPAIGAAIYGAGMQHYQQQFIHSLSAMSDNLRMVNLQAMLLAVKEMAGWTLWACLAIVLILLIIPWPRRRLKPAEIPEDMKQGL